MIMEEKRGVLTVFDDGRYIYSNKKDIRKHDDILWDILSSNGILPDNYKSLTSLDDRFLHEKSSSGKEAMIAASNGILTMFTIYDSDSDYKYAIIYLPSNITRMQKESFMEILNNNILDKDLNIYVVGTFDKGFSYLEIDNTNYVPDFIDEIIFDEYNSLLSFIKDYGNSKSK